MRQVAGHKIAGLIGDENPAVHLRVSLSLRRPAQPARAGGEARQVGKVAREEEGSHAVLVIVRALARG